MSAFAQLNPSELLRETERAAGGDELLKVHDDLIGFRKQEKKYLNESEQWTSKLENLQSRNQAVEREVSRYLERDAIMKKIDILKLTIPWIKYDEEVSAYQEAKEAKIEAKKHFEEIQARVAPLQAEIKKAQLDLEKQQNSSNTSQKEIKEIKMVYIYFDSTGAEEAL